MCRQLLGCTIVISLVTSVLGCNEFMYNHTGGSVSARALDQGYSWDVTFLYVPEGADLQGLPTDSSLQLLNYTAKFGFALATGGQESLRANDPSFTTPALGGSIDGLNSEGLSAAVLYDPNGNETFAETTTKAETVVSILDWVAYCLANFASVEEVRLALSNGTVTLSKAYAAQLSVQNLFANPYHSVVRDATKDQIVVEYTHEGELKVYNEQSLVLTNGPSFPEHLAQLESWLAPRSNGQRPTYLTVPQTAADYQNLTFVDDNQEALTSAPSKWWGPPGDYSSASRFIRLSMLNQVVDTSLQYPPNGTWSPAAYPGPFPYKPLFTAAEGILNSVLLPVGVDDKGGVSAPDDAVSDFWQFAAIRDHDNLLYWYKTPSSPMWKLIDVGELTSFAQPLFQGYSLPSNYGANRSWFEDVSLLVASSPDLQQEAENQQALLNSLMTSSQDNQNAIVRNING